MKPVLFDYPKNALFGRILPKTKIYEHGTPSTALKQFFVKQVDQIVWQYKLAPETINIPSTPSVPEIQVFRINLKGNDLKIDVLKCIDEAIPFPIIFECVCDGKVRMAATFKRPSESDSSKWVISEYFESEWMAENAERSPLPMVLDMGVLYENLLSVIIDIPALSSESLKDRVARMEIIRMKEREISKCEAQLKKEKQFNFKVEINAKLRELKKDLESLVSGNAVIST